MRDVIISQNVKLLADDKIGIRKSLLKYKFWPHVSRVDNVFGDRNPVCSCVGMENYS